MADISMDNVNIEIQSSSEKAAQGVEQLITTLSSLNQNLAATQSQVEKYSSSLQKISNFSNNFKMPNLSIKDKIPNISKELEFLNTKTPEIKPPKIDTGEIKKASQDIDNYKGKIQDISAIANKTGNRVGKMFDSLGKANIAGMGVSKLKSAFSGLGSGVAAVGKSINSAGKKIFRLTGALYGIRSAFYGVRNAANEFLSSQDATARQLSANISYLKYAIGASLAPVIEFITNLIYNLLKAIQSLVYFFARINIFSRASAKNLASGAGSAGKTTKELKKQLQAFDELNNITLENNSGSGGGGGGGAMPGFDLSQVDDVMPKFLDMIKNGDWYEIGLEIGKKINEALEKIPWDKIKSTVGKIGKNLAMLLNGVIDGTNWILVGKTFAEGLNTIIEFGYNFVTTFNYGSFGRAIGNIINGIFLNIEWAKLGQTVSGYIRGMFDMIASALEAIKWQDIARKIQEFFANMDFSGIVQEGARILEALMQGITESLPILLETAGNILIDFSTGLENSLPTLIPAAVNMIMTIVNSILERLPQVVEAGLKILTGFVQGLINALPKLISWLPTIIKTIVNVITTSLPQILNTGMTLLSSFIQGLVDCIPQLVQTLPEILNAIIEFFINNLPLVIETGMQILISLQDGIFKVIPELIKALPEIITTIVRTLANNLPRIIEMGGRMVTSLITGLLSLLWRVGQAGWDIIQSIGNVLSQLPQRAIEWGRDMIQGFINGIRSMLGSIGNAVSGIANKVRSFLHFSRPDEGPLRDYETWMPDMIKGLSDKMNQSAPKLYEASKDLAQKVAEGLDVSKIVDGTSVGINTSVTSNAMNNLGNGNPNNNDDLMYLTVNVGNETLYKGMIKNRSQASNQYGITV